jgi:hypothetical protein
MPIWRHGALRKRWRYVGVYGEEVMLCAALIGIGPLSQSFWVLWDRGSRRQLAHTRLRPGGGDVALDGNELRLAAGEVEAELRFGEGAAVESACPSGRGWGWTRKRAGLPVSGLVRAGGRRWRFSGEEAGVDDQSAGYHSRRTRWLWSAGVGRSVEGRKVAWNLVTGINDPPHGSERAIWDDGQAREPGPVVFDGLQGVAFEGGARLRFESGTERARDDNLLVLRSRYRHRFGTFTGSLDGIELAGGRGVMEEHEALW